MLSHCAVQCHHSLHWCHCHHHHYHHHYCHSLHHNHCHHRHCCHVVVVVIVVVVNFCTKLLPTTSSDLIHSIIVVSIVPWQLTKNCLGINFYGFCRPLIILFWPPFRTRIPVDAAFYLVHMALLVAGIYLCTILPRIIFHVTLNETKRIWKIIFSKKTRDMWHVTNTTFSLPETREISTRALWHVSKFGSVWQVCWFPIE